ncbi:MAG: hypothetical protein AB1813_00410 [Verrucomicrobiota bacterium]
MRASQLLFWLWTGLLVAGCNREAGTASTPEQMQERQTSGSPTKSLNELRAGLGLRVIGESWVLYRSLPTQEDWKMRKDGFVAKTVFKDASGNVSSEEDHYYSGAQFVDREGRGWERITVHYDYGTKQVYLAYTGTNATTDAMLSKFLMRLHGPSTDVAGAMAAVKRAAAGWPDAPK